MGRSAVHLALMLITGLAWPVLGQTIILDNADPEFSVLAGTWNTGSYGAPLGLNYHWSATTSSGGASAEAEWRPDLPLAGDYAVAVHHVSGANRAVNAPFTVHHTAGSTTVPVNQRTGNSTWITLGSFPFAAGTGGAVTLGNSAGPSVVIADAVRFRRTDDVQIVTADDPRLQVDGALYAAPDGYALRLDRIAPELRANPEGLFAPTVAVLTTGVRVRVRTDSATVRANFNYLSYVVTQGTGYVVFRDGVFAQLVPHLEVVEFTAPAPGVPTTYEIVCPSYDEVTFADLELAAGASLYALPPDRRLRYYALGDSITHGSELDAVTKADSTTSYAWVLAAANGWRLYNLAVGGSEVAPAFAGMLSGRRADVITILWGVNDKSRINDLPLFASKYASLLDGLRAAQPHTAIHCVTMTASTTEGAGANGYTLNDYRDAIAAEVGQRQGAGDRNIHLVRGEALSTLADLSDGVHLSVAGAARFAAGLRGAMVAPWGDFDEDGAWGLGDWAVMANGLTGPVADEPATREVNLDWDGDGDVDLREIAAFQRKFAGD